MKRLMPKVAAFGLAIGLVTLPAAGAAALAVSDYASCPSGRYLATAGSAKGYVYVKSGSHTDYASGGSNTYVKAKAKSYQTSNVFWYVSSGTGDSERPGYSNSCNIT